MPPSETGLRGIHHVQLAMPAGEAEAAVRFYGTVLGLERIPKPAVLAPRGGVWFKRGELEVHLGVEEGFRHEQFDREWEKSSAKSGDKYQVMEKLIKLPGLRSFDRNFDRLPESLRWLVEKVVHDPEKPSAPKPKLPEELSERMRGWFRDDVAALQEFTGRHFEGWNEY